MMQRVRRVGFGLFTILVIVGCVDQVPVAAQERFEVSSVKAVRPTLVDTITAFQQRDLARAKAAFEAYDSAWNGIETYINIRSKEMYQALARIMHEDEIFVTAVAQS
jgi:predicted lipid-binding transport protein (Tim44 family)